MAPVCALKRDVLPYPPDLGVAQDYWKAFSAAFRQCYIVRMSLDPIIAQLLALLFLMPALWRLLSMARDPTQSVHGLGFPFLSLAALGPAALCAATLFHGWRTDFGFSIWVSVSAAMIALAILASQSRVMDRLSVLAIPYLSTLLVLGTALGGGQEAWTQVPETWVWAHIFVAVGTYSLLTLAALSSVAVFLKEKALKKKYSHNFFRTLPSVIDAEVWQNRLILCAGIILGIGLLSGVAIRVQRDETIFSMDHKTLLAVLAFILILGFLAVQRWTGLRGRRAVRWVLSAYLLVTLAYPGVKFITTRLLNGT